MSADDPREALARQGLRAWAAFPAGREPRPVVLLDTIPAVRRSGLFPDEQDKAFLHGAVDAVPGFPAPVLEALRGHPGDYAGPPLVLVDAVLGSARYETDRGLRVLPTWEVRAQGVFHAIHILDPAVIGSGQVWEPPGRKRIGGRRPKAALGADGRTLTMSFTGDWSASVGDGPARTLESGNAVALMNMETPKPRRAGFHAGVGVRREVTAVLERPLGNRVLFDIKGAPVIVSLAAT